MKLLRIIASMDPERGGPCQGVRNSIPSLERLGVHNVVVSLDHPDAPFLEVDTFAIHALGPGKGAWCYSRKLIPWLKEHVKHFDAVIVHGLWLFPTYAVRKALREVEDAKTKVFIMPHGMLDPYFQQASVRKWKALRNWVYWKLVESKVLNDANGVFFTCQQELVLARQPFHPYKPKKEINVGYGIVSPPSPAPFMQEAFLQKCPSVKNQHYLLFLSRIHEKKGVDILIKAYDMLIKNPSTKNIPHLVIAGPGLHTSYGEEMKKMVMQNADLRKYVVFPGMLAGAEKWGAFYGCQAFILPSHQENFGIAIVEAMACGKPVLISDKTNIWQEVTDGEAGLVETDTVGGVKHLLDKWLALPDQDRKKYGERAQHVYKTAFTVESTMKRWVDALSE